MYTYIEKTTPQIVQNQYFSTKIRAIDAEKREESKKNTKNNKNTQNNIKILHNPGNKQKNPKTPGFYRGRTCVASELCASIAERKTKASSRVLYARVRKICRQCSLRFDFDVQFAIY